ncbi:L-rhamnose mutarotase [Pedococcus sp. 5OH_020]|uniref:L-rhamnose mutarotase n=1 Tax=Pedococcus sp. 5OH_020 TaxID=2989814 RepID=UPI0022E9F66D|nr:L-rhamnose mutarotase [Pedococcus sp. 5OH_020]
MHRICFVLQVKPDRVAEYRERHRDVWPSMQDALSAAGWGNYSLYLRDDGLLVGYLETPNWESAQREMALTEVNARWQESMKDFFVNLEGQHPDEAMSPLPEIFHLD